MKLGFKSTAISDVGLHRDGNEDSALVSPVLVAVADGMGGHAAGEVASKIAIDAVSGLSNILQDEGIDSDSKEDLLLNVIKEIDSELETKTKTHPDYSGMGTTLTSIAILGENAVLLHVG
mgnify:CR=1 FL=1